MSPSAEQLIRDYLNRMSVAARGQLGPDDRRALVNRTREFIDRKIGLIGPRTTIEVGRLLSGLGDPATLVQQERQRLAAVRGESPEPPASRGPIAKVLRRDFGKPRGASRHWPVVAGRTDLQLTVLDGSAADEDGSGLDGSDPDWFFRALGDESDSALEPTELAATAADAEQVPESPPSSQIRPPWPLTGTSGAHTSPGAADDDGDAEVPGDADDDAAVPGDAGPTTVSPAWQLTTPSEAVLLQQTRRALAAAVAWYRRRPLEASAVVLLGLGGAIYPPVWLLGAVVALPSRLWDGRDKWLGLALPVVLTIIAAALGVTIGGHASVGHGMHEGWVFGVIGSRVAAVLGALYLCWRSVYGRRPPAAPPWNRPHKVG